MPRPTSLPLWNVLALDRRAPVSLQAQIVAFFRDAVLRGALKPGARLPSSRQLAAELGVARITAVEAYDRLLSEGYLETRRGVGLFVAETQPDDHLRALPARVARVRRPAAGPATAPGEATAPTGGSASALPLATGLPAVDEFPWRDWARISARVLRERPAAALAYGDPQGLPGLRVAITEYLGEARGIACDADQIVVVSGSQQGIDLAARIVGAPGDRVWFEEPGYGAARAALGASQLRIVLVPADHEGLDVSAGIGLAPDARLALVTPSYHYPLGATMSLVRRRALLAWADAAGASVLEDDYYGEYRFAGRPQPPLYALDRRDRVLYLGTFSKMLAPGLRLGFLVAPPHLIARLTALKAATDRYTPGLLQLVLARFIAEGRLGAHVRRMRGIYRERREALLDALARHARDVIDPGAPPDAGLHLAVTLRVPADDVAVSRAARAAGVQATPLSTYYAGAAPVPGFVLGFANTPVAAIAPAVRRLAQCIRKAAPTAPAAPVSAPAARHGWRVRPRR